MVNQINNIGVGFANTVTVSGTKADYRLLNIYDIVNSNLIYSGNVGDVAPLTMLHPPEASKGTNLRSVLICVSGKQRSINNQCY